MCLLSVIIIAYNFFFADNRVVLMKLMNPYLFRGSVGREKRAAKLTGGEIGDVCVGSGKLGSAAVSEMNGLTAPAAASTRRSSARTSSTTSHAGSSG